MRKFVLSVFTMLLMCFQLTAQDQHVTGIVTDATSGEPIIGAVVAVKGTQNAFVTGIDGDYMIDVPANGTLEFTYVGYKTQEIVVNPGQTVINVTMTQDSENIEQVVVIGYGSARSVSSVTGSLSVVDSEILNEKPVMNVADALSGQVSGMSVMTSSGEPSASSNIRIHGSGSISAGTEPLYVIDGMPSSANQFLALSSNDIENMVTLKDASATSIYGSRAANGVIYITTKKGSRAAQKAQFRISGGYGISTPVNNNVEQMNGRDLLEWQLYFNEISRSSYDTYLADMEMFGATDWFNYVYKPAPTYNGEFSVSGGAENISYYISGSYMNQDGIAPGSSMERYTFRTNLAAEAANCIGAKSQLVRTGALYHDIGKMENPVFFTENQRGGINPHKNLNYEQSAQVVISHVTGGVKLAEKNNLPKVIKDFITTHHGKGKTKYFYISWKNEHPGEEPDEAMFTYPGPNPFTKEQAILMMADSVEAASRSLPQYDEESISNLVEKIIDSQVAEGYFKECPITFKDIATVKEVFKEKLKTIYHTRISYPELKKQEEKK